MRLRGLQRAADGVYMPMVPIRAHFAGGPTDHLAILDSGADATIFSAELLPSSIDYDSLEVLPEPGQGVGCTFEVRRCPVEIYFQQWKICDHIQVIEPDKSPTPIALLGREDFFKRFTVYFDWTRTPGEFEIHRKGR